MAALTPVMCDNGILFTWEPDFESPDAPPWNPAVVTYGVDLGSDWQMRVSRRYLPSLESTGCGQETLNPLPIVLQCLTT